MANGGERITDTTPVLFVVIGSAIGSLVLTIRCYYKSKKLKV